MHNIFELQYFSLYYLKDLGDGSGTFVRIDEKIPIKQGNIITFGNFHLVLNYKIGKEPDPENKLFVQLVDETQPKEQFEFSSDKSPVVIGRSESASIKIKSHALSRIQCRLTYEKEGWFLDDGDGNKKSTNGTWIYVEDPYLVKNNMIFKAGLVLFRVHIQQL